MYKIAESDLDGTLLTSEHQILPFTKQVLTQLHEQGKEFIFATGRHHIDVAQMREKLGIPAFMITSNGACVHNSENEIIFQQYMDEEIVAGILEMFKSESEIIVHLYRSNDWLINRKDFIFNLGKGGFTHGFFDIENPPLENIEKVFFTREDKDHDKLVIWEDKIRTKFGQRAHITFSAPYCLEIMDVGVSKGHALDAIAKIKGYQLKDCIAFGDGMNDLEMLSMAGKGVIMGTAHEKVKKSLPNNEVIGCCNDQAVAHYLAEHVLD